MRKFKIGDIIVGTTPEDEVYSFTTEDAVMKVVDVMPSRGWGILVEIISHANYPEQKGNRYSVSSEFFKLRKPVSLENK